MSGTYSFKDVQVSIVGPGGAFSLGSGEGVAEEGVVIALANDKDTMTEGIDGEVMHTMRAGNSGTITVTLLQTSPRNQALMALYNAQRLDSRLWGKNVITVSQSAAGDIVTAVQCAFKKVPDISYVTAGGKCAWAFNCGHIDEMLGTY